MPRSAHPLLGLAAVAIGTIPAPLDSAVNIAFPSITAAFGMVVEDIRWVIISYVLTHSSLMLVCGKLGDLLGYRRIFIAGLVVSTVAFTACSLAPTLGMLLIGRVLQGVGIALTLSVGPALATSLFDEGQRTRVLAAYTAITAVGMALGPLAGGILVEWFGWPVVFWARVPLVVGALLLAVALPAGTRTVTMRGFDGFSAVLFVACNAGLLLTVAAHSTIFGTPLQIGFAVLGIMTLVAFIARNRRSASPVIRPALFRDNQFVGMNLAAIAMQFAAFSIMLLVPFWLARTAGLAAGVAGLVLCLAAVGNVVGASIAGHVAPRVGAVTLAAVGAGLSVIGLWGISTWTADTDMPLMAATLLTQGFGLGLFQVAYTDRVVGTLPPEERGVAGSLTMVTRTIGVVGAATGLAAAHRWFEGAALGAGQSARDAFVHGFQITFRGVSVALGLAVILALARARARKTP
jgi:MFS family permease